jgi:signal transduction histidine kinase
MSTKAAGDERRKTDDSLAVERAKADVAMQEKLHFEEVEDAVSGKARDTADAVLRSARARTDDQAATSTVSPVVIAERHAADQELAHERAHADEVLQAERAARTRLLARLLPLERDQTDQYLLTERARSDEAVANREDILAMVSHDLRDLLGTVVLSASAIVDAANGDAVGGAQATTARRIQRAAGRMARLISDLVDIASIDAGKLAVTPVATDAFATIADAIETWSPPALAKGVRLEARGADSLVGVFDRERVLQVLGNLITNAAKFSDRGASITVSAEAVDRLIRFSVTDEGEGIPEGKLEAVFERFWQAGKSDRRGLGLGLYISRCIVEAHGGTIWATSKEGAGSTFFFTMPLQA